MACTQIELKQQSRQMPSHPLPGTPHLDDRRPQLLAVGHVRPQHHIEGPGPQTLHPGAAHPIKLVNAEPRPPPSEAIDGA